LVPLIIANIFAAPADDHLLCPGLGWVIRHAQAGAIKADEARRGGPLIVHGSIVANGGVHVPPHCRTGTNLCLSRFISPKGLLVETDMRIIGVALFALSVASFGMANVTMAQDTTVIHKESADSDRSKTIVKHDDGSKTVIKRHGDRVKKIHTAANGDKTIVKKTTY